MDRPAVEAVADGTAVDPHLAHAAALGLTESAVEPGTDERQYYVSTLVRPLLEGELGAEDRAQAVRLAARHLYQAWWVGQKEGAEQQVLEAFRLALLASEQPIAAEVGDAIATAWFDRGRFRDGKVVCEAAISLGEDYRVLHSLARCEEVLGEATEALAHFESAFPNAHLLSRLPRTKLSADEQPS